jgi:retinol dehydrogenase-12
LIQVSGLDDINRITMLDSIYALFAKYPYPDVDCTGKTIIVTGANIGLGKEAVRHFVRLNACKVILAVRSIAKGKVAQADIEATTHHPGVTEVWELDLSSYASVKAFAAKAAELPRVDAVVANASIATHEFELAENNESTITVNVVSTMLLVLLLLPTLSASASKWGTVPVVTVVTSNIHSWTSFPEWKTPNSLATLNDKETAVMTDRLVSPPSLNLASFRATETNISPCCSYPVSKLLQVFAVREIAAKIANKQPKVVLNMLNPGLCKTALTRNATGMTGVTMAVSKALLGRTAEEGSRVLVYAATLGPDSQGLYISDCKIAQ